MNNNGKGNNNITSKAKGLEITIEDVITQKRKVNNLTQLEVEK